MLLTYGSPGSRVPGRCERSCWWGLSSSTAPLPSCVPLGGRPHCSGLSFFISKMGMIIVSISQGGGKGWMGSCEMSLRSGLSLALAARAQATGLCPSPITYEG